MQKRNKFRQSVAQQEEGRAPKIFLPQGPEEAKSATVVWCVPWVVHTPYADHIKYFNFTMHSAIMLIIVWLTSIYNSHVCAPPSIYRHISHRIAGWGECVWLCCIDYAPCEPRVCVLCVFAWARFFFFLFACATPLSRIPIAGTELTWWCFLFSSLRRWLHQVNCVNVMIFQFNLKRPTAKQRSATTVLGVSCVWTRQWGGNLLLLQLLWLQSVPMNVEHRVWS